MPAFVIDASVTLPWCFADEATEATNSLLARLKDGEEAVAPPHWLFEVGNALLIASRRKRISSQDVHRFLEDLEVLPIRVHPINRDRIRQRVLPLAEQYELTVYDVAYLELALIESLPLATLDNALCKASRVAGITLIEA